LTQTTQEKLFQKKKNKQTNKQTKKTERKGKEKRKESVKNRKIPSLLNGNLHLKMKMNFFQCLSFSFQGTGLRFPFHKNGSVRFNEKKFSVISSNEREEGKRGQKKR